MKKASLRSLDILYRVTMVALYLTILALKVFAGRDGAGWIIPVYVFAALLYSIYKSVSRTRLISLALFFALLGDIFINCTPWKQGAAVFCLTHACLIICCLRYMPPARRDIVPALPVFCTGLAYYLLVRADLPDKMMHIAFALYLFLISVMLWRALCLRGGMFSMVMGVGALLFFLTDLSVLSDALYAQRALSILTWLLYPPALFLLSMAGKYAPPETVAPQQSLT